MVYMVGARAVELLVAAPARMVVEFIFSYIDDRTSGRYISCKRIRAIIRS